MSPVRNRQLIVLRGTRAETWDAACRLLAGAPSSFVLNVSQDPDEIGRSAIREGQTASLLGQTIGIAVLDAHGGLDPETLGQVSGTIAGGGALILRLDAGDDGWLRTSPETRRRLAAWPYTVDDVGDRWFRRFLKIAESQTITAPNGLTLPSQAREVESHPEQARVVARLAEVLVGAGPARVVVTAPRGRGKSAALGMALREVLRARGGERCSTPARILVCSWDEHDTYEIKRFMGPAQEPKDPGFTVEYLSAAALAGLVPAEVDVDSIVIVDEAARLPLPVLRGIVAAHADAKLVFATTTDGYEGTGQGFVLRFVAWLGAQPEGCEIITMTAPIRWSPDDTIEPFVYRALLLAAKPAEREVFGLEPSGDEATWALVNRDALVADEALLGEIFGLLRHAHYRTTPRDLEAILDAPNMHLHILTLSGHVAAVCLVADEGRLSDTLADDATRGRTRLRAHAIPDSLCAHMGMREAGPLHYLRSVRIATHPELRRLGLASKLVAAVHTHHQPDVFGTLFGATADVIEFRRGLGYEVVRVSASRGARTGEPSVLMLRPRTTAGQNIVAAARARFEAGWPFQQQWIFGDGGAPDALVVAALNAGVPDREALPPLSPQELARDLDTYLHGAQTFEQAARPIATLVNAATDALESLPKDLRALVAARVVERTTWELAAKEAGMAHAGIAMKAMRRAVGALAVTAGLDVRAPKRQSS